MNIYNTGFPGKNTTKSCIRNDTCKFLKSRL